MGADEARVCTRKVGGKSGPVAERLPDANLSSGVDPFTWGESDRKKTWKYRKRCAMAWKHESKTFPRTAGQLRRWLRDTVPGRTLVKELAKDFLEKECRRCERRRPYPRVLVVIRRLGYKPGAEVFYEKGITVRLEELVDSQGDASIELLVEKLLLAQLPRSWKHLPNCRSESMVFSGLTATRRIESLEILKLIRELKEIRWPTTE